MIKTVHTIDDGSNGVNFVGGQRQLAFFSDTGLVGVGPGGHAGNTLQPFTLWIFAGIGTPCPVQVPVTIAANPGIFIFIYTLVIEVSASWSGTSLSSLIDTEVSSNLISSPKSP